ncbi:C2H2 finger domain containing protein [Perkinsela sp. CCAP 1560/4]|nr:C2H2 finger domain containing protein [Perkinsela sp. CCAP 1560/4]|eukprot:KNH06477.1 C2H2 finger domain containing protein [Perkinsela sp. CCAP 1560/4]
MNGKSAALEDRYSVPPIKSATSGSQECIVCAEDIAVYAIYKCGHICCHTCGLRIRKSGDIACPICRRDSDYLHMTLDPSANTRIARNNCFNKTMGFYYDDQRIFDVIEKLDAFLCPYKRCWDSIQRPFKSFFDLQNHLKGEHFKVYCETCVKDRTCFLVQQLLYPPEELELHIKGKHPSDSNTFLGHIFCNFCRKYFYDLDQFMCHMRMTHFPCDLCSSIKPNRFFSDRRKLYMHYHAEHFICQHPGCAETDILLKTFSSELELQSHSVKVHRSKGNKKVPLSLKSLGLSFDNVPKSSIERSFSGLSIEQRRSNILIFDFLSSQRQVDLSTFKYEQAASSLPSESEATQRDRPFETQAGKRPQYTEYPQVNTVLDKKGAVFATRYKNTVMNGERDPGLIKPQKPEIIVAIKPHAKSSIADKFKETIDQQESDKLQKKPNKPMSFPSLQKTYKVPKSSVHSLRKKKSHNVWHKKAEGS